jgi:SpoVK/Ycf46/Vps4 family AAA+-type ATPase
LRPGRFEVQIEIPPPVTVEQRISILKVHTKHMYNAGRLQVSDPPSGSPASRHLVVRLAGTNCHSNFLDSVPPQVDNDSTLLLSYESLLRRLAIDCEGFSGAALAGVARAAASHALERAVDEFSEKLQEGTSRNRPRGETPSIMDCLVTQDDFYEAIMDIRNDMGTHDFSEEVNGNSPEKE